MKQVFETSVGTVEVRIDHESRTIGAYRFDDQHHAAAAAIESWDYVELSDLFTDALDTMHDIGGWDDDEKGLYVDLPAPITKENGA